MVPLSADGVSGNYRDIGTPGVDDKGSTERVTEGKDGSFPRQREDTKRITPQYQHSSLISR